MRLAHQHDVARIMPALAAMLDKSPAPQMKYADLITAECGVRHAIHEERGFVIGGYFVMVDCGSDWYTTRRYLIEQIILKIDKSDKSASIDDAVASLAVIAKRFGCAAVAVGDTQIGYMTPIYHRHGYVTLGTQLMKDV